MSDNTLFVMFEEIKASLSEINKKLNKTEDNSEIEEANNPYLKEIDGRFIDIHNYIQLRLKEYHMNEMARLNHTIKSEIKDLENLLVSGSPKFKYIHNYTIDLKSSKTFLLITSLSVSLILCIMGLVYQYDKASRFEDSDWKFRYVKSTRGINGEQLGALENIFVYNRDQNKIDEVKEYVIRYEFQLADKARNLEQHEFMKDKKE